MTDFLLHGVRVLIPRAPGRGEALAARIEAAGGTAVVAPLISRADAEGPDLEALRAATVAARAGEYAWVAITSVNAVAALMTAAAPDSATAADSATVPSSAAVPGAATVPDSPVDLGLSAPTRALVGPSSGQVPEFDGGADAGTRADTDTDTRADSGAGASAGVGVSGSRAAAGDRGLAGWPVRWAAVGPATARALRRAGVEPELVAAENSADGMLAEWPDARVAPGAGATDGAADRVTDHAPDRATAHATPPHVLLPLGDLAEPTLERGLVERGYTPVRVTAYRTVAHPAPPEVVADWVAGRIHLVVLTSGSVAREVARQLGPRPDVLAVAIGQPTRRAAEGTGQRVAAVATSATDDALFSAIIEAATLLPTPPTTRLPTILPTTTTPPTTLPEDQ